MSMRFLILTAVVGLTACGGGDNGGGPNPGNNLLAKPPSGSGDGQSGEVALPLASPFCAKVTKDGTAQGSIAVGWSTTGGGNMSSASAQTDVNGLSCSTLTLGHTAGAQTAMATLSGATGSPLTFNATGTAGGAVSLLKGSGDGQTGSVNQDLANPLLATVTDAFGNGVSGVTIQWSVTAGTAVLTPTNPTNSSGNGSTVVTLGPTAGPITIQAAVNGLTGSPVSYSASAQTAPTAITIQVVNFQFNPGVDTVAVGGTVTWNWAATATAGHSVTSTGPTSFTSDPAGISTPPHTYGPITFNTPGTYFYYCMRHGFPGNPPTGMHGTIVVE